MSIDFNSIDFNVAYQEICQLGYACVQFNQAKKWFVEQPTVKVISLTPEGLKEDIPPQNPGIITAVKQYWEWLTELKETQYINFTGSDGSPCSARWQDGRWFCWRGEVVPKEILHV